jgi:hypothetical protein
MVTERSPRPRSHVVAPAVAVAVAALLAVSACTLDRVTTAEPEDVVVTEITLRTGILKQVAFLHHTLGAGAAGDSVPGADIQITAPGGRVMRFVRTVLTDCLTDRPAREQLGTCYSTLANNTITIDPGAQYSLRVTLADGKVMTGVTTVAGDFHFVHPPATAATCSVRPFTPVELAWTLSSNAWVYLDETNLTGLRAAYAGQGITVSSDPLRLVGLSVSASDTTIVFPGEFGIFDRGDDARGELLVALQKGLPPATSARVMVAAGDRNYVNWARGGNFNPSGPVRVPSIRGDGTGVFGSLHNKSINIRVGDPIPTAPSCQ